MGILLASPAMIATAPKVEEPRLLNIAKMVVEIDPSARRASWGDAYLWWSPTNILILKGDNEEEILDLSTGNVVPYPVPALRKPGMTMSPDRTRFIEETEGNGVKTCVISKLDGKREPWNWTMIFVPEVTFNRDGYPKNPYLLWSTDNGNIFEVDYANLGGNFRIKISERESENPERVHVYPDVTLEDGYCTAILMHDGKALVEHWNSPLSGFKFEEWSLKAPALTRRSWSVAPPKGLYVKQFFPSPNFKKAVWIMDHAVESELSYDLGPFHQFPASIWISDLEGKGMKEIGAIPRDMDPKAEPQNIESLQWSPDSQRVSFIYRKKLYILPIK